jgi:hypothetical protein
MNNEHKHSPGRDCDGLCHLNDAAWLRYWELMHGNCPEQAEILRTGGVWA